MVKTNQKIDKTSAAHLQEKQRQAKKEKKERSIVIPNFSAALDESNTSSAIKKEKKMTRNNTSKKEEESNQQKEGNEEEQTLSRKEKRKQILSERLDRKLTALEKIHEQNNLTLAQQQEESGEDKDDDDDDDDDTAASSSSNSNEQSQSRHDDAAQEDSNNETDAKNDENDDEDEENDDDGDVPVKAQTEGDEQEPGQQQTNQPPKRQQIKQVAAAEAAPRKAKLGGTYWKDRKDKQKRTIFIGGIPANAGLGLVRRLINQYGADGAVADPKHDIEVDFIRPKNFEAAKFRNDQHGKAAIPKNAYCVLPSTELAVRVAHALDGVWVHPEEAIPITDRDANCWRQNHPQSRDKPCKLRVNSADDKGQRDIAISKRKGGDGSKDSYYRNNKRGSKPGSLPPKKFAKKN